ncbi:MAG TPA: cell division protein FtsQ/DivIB, partial [Xylella sp.]
VGRDDARARLQRFARVLPQLLDPQRPIVRADLRYTNGFTIVRGSASVAFRVDGRFFESLRVSAWQWVTSYVQRSRQPFIVFQSVFPLYSVSA